MLRNHKIQMRGCDDLLLLEANDVEPLVSAAQCLKEVAKESRSWKKYKLLKYTTDMI